MKTRGERKTADEGVLPAVISMETLSGLSSHKKKTQQQ